MDARWMSVNEVNNKRPNLGKRVPLGRLQKVF
jgi:hypothetical protein